MSADKRNKQLEAEVKTLHAILDGVQDTLTATSSALTTVKRTIEKIYGCELKAD